MKILITYFLIIFCLELQAFSKKLKTDTSPSPIIKNFINNFPEALEAGYAWPTVGLIGEEIKFFIHLKKETSKLEFRRITSFNSEKKKPIYEIKFNSLPTNLLTECSPSKGCKWAANISFKIPRNWKPGFYVASFKDSKKLIKKIYFFIKSNSDHFDFLFLNDWTTYQAYNFYGGQNVYVNLHKNRLRYNGTVEKEISSSYSLKRPLYAKTPSYNSKGEINGFENGLKDIMFGFAPLESLYNLKYQGQVLPNNFNLENNQFDLNSFKTIVVTGLQEYLSLDFIEKLRDYLKSGGNLIIASEEFAFRRIRTSPDNFEFYFKYYNDPLFPDSPNKVASQFAGQINLSDYFGFSIGYGTSFSYLSENRQFNFIEKTHPLVKPLLDKKVHINRYWAPGVLLKKGSDQKLCIISNSINCKKQIVLGLFTEDNSNRQSCCRDQAQFDKALDGVIDKTPKEILTEINMGFYYAQYGKGHLVVAPFTKFFKGDNFYKWYPSFLKFIKDGKGK